MNCTPPDLSVHCIHQARILEWVSLEPGSPASQADSTVLPTREAARNSRRSLVTLISLSCISDNLNSLVIISFPSKEFGICYQFSHSVVSDSLQPQDCSKSGLPVYHQLLEFTETHVCCVDDGIQPSNTRLSPSQPAFNLSQHPGLIK